MTNRWQNNFNENENRTKSILWVRTNMINTHKRIYLPKFVADKYEKMISEATYAKLLSVTVDELLHFFSIFSSALLPRLLCDGMLQSLVL